MLRRNYNEFQELLPGDLNIRHKVAMSTEKTTFHLHSHLEIIYTISDNLVYFTESAAQRLPAGTLLLLDSMSLHYIDCLHDDRACDRYVLYFNPAMVHSLNTPEINLLDCFLRHRGDGYVLLPEADLGARIHSILEQMVNCFPNSDMNGDASLLFPEDQLFLKLQLGQLLLLIHRRMKTEQSNESQAYQAHSHSVSEICQYINEHYPEELSVNRIAREFLISRTQLYNLFKEVLHMSITDYLQQVRLTQAKSLLLNTTYSVEIVSQMVGYGNISSFSRVFKAKTGEAPLQYRKKKGGAPFPLRSEF